MEDEAKAVKLLLHYFFIQMVCFAMNLLQHHKKTPCSYIHDNLRLFSDRQGFEIR